MIEGVPHLRSALVAQPGASETSSLLTYGGGHGGGSQKSSEWNGNTLF